ncbi:GntR family transcriptional regulator [Arthrobacter roseus]|nr:GntR family transcriptional regulator [Arthrobacter roseus]
MSYSATGAANISQSLRKLRVHVATLEGAPGTPKHMQLREQLRPYIVEHCTAGESVPSERDLAQYFRVARMTVRHAIDALVAEELLERVVGVGTYVAQSKVDLQIKLTSYSEEMHRRGMVPDAHVLSFEQIGATPRLARELQLEEGQPVIRFRRQLLADGDPMSFDENFIPASRVPGILDDPPPTSLYNVLSEKYGLVMEWGEDTIEATAASPSIARLLHVEMGAPLLKIERHAYVSRAMVDYSVSYYRADRYKLWVPLQRPGIRSPRGYSPRRLARP